MRWRAMAVLGAALLLYACASTPAAEPPAPDKPAPQAETQRPAPERREPRVRPARPPAPESEAPPETPRAAPILGMRPQALPGWAYDNHLAALEAYRSGCGLSRDVASQSVCNAARLLVEPDAVTARRFFEEHFAVEALPGTGLLTAYFSPQYEAHDAPGGQFLAAVRAAPEDLRPGQTYAERKTIEARPPNGALAWMRAEDLFFLQIQGSGVLVYPDGRRMKAVFAAHNSRPFQGIANAMRDRGLLAAGNTSGEAIRGWLADHRGPEAAAIMQLNPRYVFFTLEPDDGVEPTGAAGIPLTAGHAIAVDPREHAYGELIWIDGAAPTLAGAFPAYQRLVMALDTGGAITGPIRADLYLGRGDEAGREAGRVRHDLHMYRLVPIETQ